MLRVGLWAREVRSRPRERSMETAFHAPRQCAVASCSSVLLPAAACFKLLVPPAVRHHPCHHPGTADYRVKSEALQYECGVEVSL